MQFHRGSTLPKTEHACQAATPRHVPDAGHCVQASSVPLVGVWVSGIASPTHPLVWLACLKFFVTHQLQDKVTQGNEAFLLLLYTTGQNTAFQANRLLPMVVCNALATVISA